MNPITKSDRNRCVNAAHHQKKEETATGRTVVIGLLDRQARVVARRTTRTDLCFIPARIRMPRLGLSDRVIVMTRWVSHEHSNHANQQCSNVICCRGGLTSLIRILG